MLWFQHPPILYLLPLAALPLLLHLFSRELPPRLQFPFMRFLLRSPLPHQGRRRWQDWLLMMVRMALIAVLCLALAGPRWTPRRHSDDEAQAQPSAIAILLDSSASMLALAETARQVAAEAIKSSQGWECALFAFDRSVLRLDAASLEEWAPGYQEGNPADALRAASQWLETHPHAAERRLVIISDFQRTNWNVVLPGLPDGVSLALHPVGLDRRPENASLTSVQSTIVGEDQLQIRVGWRNWSDQALARDLHVSLGTQEISQAITLPPHTEGATAVVTALPDHDKQAAVTLAPQDGWSGDDQRRFWAQREPPVPVLLLLPDGSSDGPLADELEFFIQRALTAERPGVPGHFSVDSLGASALPLIDLTNYGLIVLAGSAERLPEDCIPQLREFQSHGNSILFVPGNAPVAAWRLLHQAGLLTAPEQGLARHATGIGPVPENSPLGGIFPPNAPSDLHLFAIRQTLRVPTVEGGTVLLQTLDGQPALLQCQNGSPGSLYAFTFAFQLENTDFPLSQSFLPILRELCTEATRTHSTTIRLNCGEDFPELRSPDGTLLALSPPITSAQPGLTHLGSHPVEINPPAAESSPEAADLEELRRLLTTSGHVNSAKYDLSPETMDATRNLRKWCLAGLAALAVLELLLLLAGRPAHRDSERHIFSTLWR